jgi:proteasome accessory factor C
MDHLGIVDERQFERVKDALRRSLGVALEEADGIYRLAAEGYAMPPLEFTQEERTALALALREWRGSEVERAAAAARTKLTPLGLGAGGDWGGWGGLDIASYAPMPGAFELISAIAERRVATFDYRTGYSGEVAARRVQPWQLTKWRGAYYLLGFDLDRADRRVYALARIVGEVVGTGPANAFDPPAAGEARRWLLESLKGEDKPEALLRAIPEAARMLIAEGATPIDDAAHPKPSLPQPSAVGGAVGGVAGGVVADGLVAGVASSGGGSGGVGTASAAGGVVADGLVAGVASSGGGSGGVGTASAAGGVAAGGVAAFGTAELRLRAADPFALAAWGAGVEVLEPARLRQEVRDRLEGAAKAHQGEGRPVRPYAKTRSLTKRRREAGVERAARMVSLVSYLQEQGPSQLRDLAQRFGVSTSVVQSDLNLLWCHVGRGEFGGELLDFGWSANGDEVWLVESQGLEQPLRLAPVEAITLIAALRSLEEADGLSEASAAQTARAKLEQALGPSDRVDVNLPPAPPVLALLRQAIALGRTVEFGYVDQSGKPSRRRVDPLGVASGADHWALDAWDHQADAERHFRVDRITDAALGATPVARHRRRPATGHWSQRAELQADVVFSAAERWRAEQLETLAPPAELPGGSLQVKLGVVNPAWITRLALGGGGAIEVLTPPDLRQSIHDAARAGLNH